MIRLSPGWESDRSADTAWESAGLNRITPHECRHTYASLMIAAGVNAKALSTFMGHANIKITLDLYGHLFPGSEEEAAGMLDRYLAAQIKVGEDAARAAETCATGEPLANRWRTAGEPSLNLAWLNGSRVAPWIRTTSEARA